MKATRLIGLQILGKAKNDHRQTNRPCVHLSGESAGLLEEAVELS